MKKRRNLLIGIIGYLSTLCILIGLISAISNIGLPKSSQTPDRLNSTDKALLAEAIHLREIFGDRVMPGWGQTDIPMIAYNEAYIFLLGYQNPPDGWKEAPGSQPHGGAWQVVPDDIFVGQLYYRQPVPASGKTPQAFTALIGNRWVSSMTTKEWFEIKLAAELRDMLPPIVNSLTPYRLVVPLFVGSSEGYITKVLHESFHAFQGIHAPGRLSDSENANRVFEERYPFDNPDQVSRWENELDLLANALEADSDEETLQLVGQFLEIRQMRRDSLPPEMIDYERQREWLEGMAKYAEMEIWRQGFLENNYLPLPAMNAIEDFNSYATFQTAWQQEVGQIRRMADSDGEVRFYYSGMAQAALLDILFPDWKTLIWMDGIWLETLLGETLR